MKSYDYQDDTLIHSIGFNPYKMESVMKNGILSNNEAQRRNVYFTRNHDGYNFNDYISMIRYMYVNHDDENSAYNKYAKKGISFIVENQAFIFNQDEMYFNHRDEVFVKDYVPTSNIVGILVPEKYLDYLIKDLPMISLKSTSYVNIKHTCDDLIRYLNTLNFSVSLDEYNIYLNELYQTNEAIRKQPNIEGLKEDFFDCVIALNEFLAEQTNEAIDSVLHKDNCTLIDMINYINNKTLDLDIYRCGYSLSRR